MTKEMVQRQSYEAPRIRVKDILFEHNILSWDNTLNGSGGEDADDELEPGF